jgi:hypothetical protein
MFDLLALQEHSCCSAGISARWKKAWRRSTLGKSSNTAKWPLEMRVRLGSASALGFRQIICEDGGAGFDEVLFGFVEGAGKIAIDIEFGGELLVDEDGDDDFGLHKGRAGEIARILGNIVDHDYLSAASRGSAQAGTEGNTRVGHKTADIGSDQEHAAVGRIDQIKANPVVVRHLFVETLGDALHEGLGGGSARGKFLEFAEKFFVRWGHVSADRLRKA